jgi:hypothetical protein
MRYLFSLSSFSHCDHNKINAAAVTKLSIPSEVRYGNLFLAYIFHQNTGKNKVFDMWKKYGF